VYQIVETLIQEVWPVWALDIVLIKIRAGVLTSPALIHPGVNIVPLKDECLIALWFSYFQEQLKYEMKNCMVVLLDAIKEMRRQEREIVIPLFDFM
jgi:hypothetical protein